LNSHRLFFLSYAAPVVWSLSIVAATVAAGQRGAPDSVAVWAAWGAVVGSALQLLIQLPAVRRAAGTTPLRLDPRSPSVATVTRNFGPAFVARGIVQISAFLDAWIASWLPIGSVAALSNAQLLYTLPISLFGMSVAAAELPAMAEVAGDGQGTSQLAERLRRGTDRVAFFVIPAAVAFVALGRQIAGVVFQSGAFTTDDAIWVWGTLAAATVGLLPQAWGRLLNTTHYALGDTRTPFRFAVARVIVSIALGVPLAFLGPDLLDLDARWGTAGLTLGTSAAATVEWLLLRRSLIRRLGRQPPRPDRWKPWVAAAIAAGAGWVGWTIFGPSRVAELASIMVFGLTYLGAAALLRVPEFDALRSGLRR
jgi:putative peptidoglycan lipid II flippase